MNSYPSISTVFKRDPATNYKTLLMGEWAEPAFEYLQNNLWIFDEKVDGTNIRVMINKPNLIGEPTRSFEFGGRTDKANMPMPLMNNLNALFTTEMRERLMEQFRGGGCLYGEGYGIGIQGKIGTAYGCPPSFTLFDVNVCDARVEGGWWLEKDIVREIAKAYGLDTAPSRGVGTLHDMIDIVRSGMVSAYSQDVPFQAEGLVARPLMDLKTRKGGRIITKLKTVDFTGKGS
jgi:RNA ligase